MKSLRAKISRYFKFLGLTILLNNAAFGQEPLQIKGVFPQMSTLSNHKDRTEAGIGAVIT